MPNPIHTRRDTGNQIKAALRRDASGLWLFENSGNLGLDSSPQGNHLTNNNSVSQVAGRVGQAASFASASSQYLSTASVASLQATGSFTIAAWAQATTLAVNEHAIVGKWASSPNLEYILEYFSSPNRLIFQVGYTDGSAQPIVNADALGVPSTGVWYCLIGWVDTVAQTLNIQVNNGTINSVAFTKAPKAGAAAFQIGAYNSLNFWNGVIDQVGKWNRVLTTAERAWLYNGGAGRSLA